MKLTRTIPNNFLIKQLPNATVFVNKKFEVVYASDQWMKNFNLEKEEVFGISILGLFKDGHSDWRKALKNCLLGAHNEKVKAQHYEHEKEEKWYELINTPWYDDQENIIGVIIQGIDITFQVHDEIRREKLESLLRDKTEIAKIGSWEYDAVNNKTTWCNMTKQIHEVPINFEPNIENGIEFYKHGYSRNTLAMHVDNALRKGIPWEKELQIVTGQGIEKWIISAGKPIFNNDKIVGLIGTCQDIDYVVQTSIKTKENEHLLKTLIDNLPLNIYIKDKDSRKILVNKSESDFVGLGSPEELIGKTDFDVYDRETANNSRNEDLTVINTLKPIIGKTETVIKKDGTQTIFSISKLPFYDENNEVQGIIGMSLDITDRKRAEKELEEKERNFRSIFNSSYQFTGILSPDGTFIEINDTALKFANLTADKIINKKFWEAYWWPTPDFMKEGLKEMIKAASQGQVMRNEIVVLDYEKKPVNIDFSLKPIYDDDKQIISLLAEGRMITEMVMARQKLKESETKFRTLYELSPVSFLLFNLETGDVLDFNPSFQDTTGFDQQTSNTINYWNLSSQKDKKTIDRVKAEIIKNGKFGPFEEKLTKKDGSEYPVITNHSLSVNKKGENLVWCISQDISESESKERQIREERKLLRTLVDNLPLNVYIKDTESRKILANKAECDFLGVKNQEELLGLSDFDLYDNEIAQISRDEDMSVMRTMKPILGRETLNVKKDGTQTSFLTSKIPLKDENGVVTGIVGISLDITDLKQKEAELRDLINVTSLQNKKLINFAHIISHNLRSHTANFSMLLDFLLHEKDEEEKMNIIKMLTNASDNLLETLDNLNEVVAISTNVNLEKKHVNLNDKIEIVKQNLKGFLINSNVKVINSIPDSAIIYAIPSYVDNILMNLITNAVKYSKPDRSPIIKLSIKSNSNYKVLSIEDNGIGINMQKYGDKLFGMYKTFHDNADARGIGLYIIKNQIEAMNGKINVQSEVDKGTIFNIHFNDKN